MEDKVFVEELFINLVKLSQTVASPFSSYMENLQKIRNDFSSISEHDFLYNLALSKFVCDALPMPPLTEMISLNNLKRDLRGPGIKLEDDLLEKLLKLCENRGKEYIRNR